MMKSHYTVTDRVVTDTGLVDPDVILLWYLYFTAEHTQLGRVTTLSPRKHFQSQNLGFIIRSPPTV